MSIWFCLLFSAKCASFMKKKKNTRQSNAPTSKFNIGSNHVLNTTWGKKQDKSQRWESLPDALHKKRALFGLKAKLDEFVTCQVLKCTC